MLFGGSSLAARLASLGSCSSGFEASRRPETHGRPKQSRLSKLVRVDGLVLCLGGSRAARSRVTTA